MEDHSVGLQVMKPEMLVNIAYIITRGRDGTQRSLQVRMIKGGQIARITRPIKQFCLMEITYYDVKNRKLTDEYFLLVN